ncbi:MAG: hypothetical protein AAGI49_14050 [Bacteroidota bacterium]
MNKIICFFGLLSLLLVACQSPADEGDLPVANQLKTAYFKNNRIF